jgi:hypothetical protein
MYELERLWMMQYIFGKFMLQQKVDGRGEKTHGWRGGNFSGAQRIV